MPTPLDAFGAQIRPPRKRVVNRGCAIEDSGLFVRNNHAVMIAPKMTTPYQPSSTSCTPIRTAAPARAGSSDTNRQGARLGGSGLHGEGRLRGKPSRLLQPGRRADFG